MISRTADKVAKPVQSAQLNPCTQGVNRVSNENTIAESASPGDFSQSGRGAEVLKKTVQAEQLKLFAKGDPPSSGEAAAIQSLLLCPEPIKFLETVTWPVVPSAVKMLRVIREGACLSAVHGGPVKRLAGPWREDRGGRRWEMVLAISIPSSTLPPPPSTVYGSKVEFSRQDSGSKGERRQKVEGEEETKEEERGVWKCCF